MELRQIGGPSKALQTAAGLTSERDGEVWKAANGQELENTQNE